jgi:hypothetical protein
MREFTSTPADAEELEPPHEVPFKLDGVEFKCLLRGDADSLLGWSELASTASAETDLQSQEGAAFVHRFFTMVMDTAEYRRFRAHLKSNTTHPQVLSEVMGEIDREMREFTEGRAERPTVPLSSSSGGQQDPAARRLQIASLDATEDGEVVFAPRPNREARRRLEREQERALRGAGSAATG